MITIRNIRITLIWVLLLIAVLGTASAYAAVDSKSSQEIQLTETQKEELASLYKELFEKRKEIISKYVEYGLITKEKGERIISRLEKHYNKLESNDFYLEKNKQ